MLKRDEAASATGLRLPRSVNQVLILVLTLGVASVIGLVLLLPNLNPPQGIPTTMPRGWQIVLFVAMAAAGELISVRIRRGDTSEDLTFLEVVLVAGALTMPPLVTLGAMLVGLVIASLLQRRDSTKTLFNLGSYATSVAAMLAVYYVLDFGHERFTWQSVLALIVANLVFALINVMLLALIFHVVVGDSPGDYVTGEWQLSAAMAVGGVAVAMPMVFLADHGAWPLVPFVGLPLLALWYAYSAAAQHVEARERNRSLVTLGSALAEQGRGEGRLRDLAEAVREVFAAPEVLILEPGSASGPVGAVLTSLRAGDPPRSLAAHDLPPSWNTGIVAVLDLGAEDHGALLLGSKERYRRSRIAGRTRGWALDDADAPVLGALVAAVGSAMRAGAAFEALKEETAKLTAVVDNTSDGIAMVDAQGKVRLWSRTMELMTGVSAGSLIDDALPMPTAVRTIIDASKRTPSGAPPKHVHVVRADGEELDISLTTVRVRVATTTADAAGAGSASILTAHDETQERRVERMKFDFLATVTHELRTPITPIKGYAHLLATRGDRITPEKRDHALQVISDRADHLSRMVDDLLVASKASETGRLGVRMGVEDASSVVTEAVAGFPRLAPRITVHLPEQPLRVACDRIRTVQCLANLLSNAEKYAVGDGTIDVRVQESGRRVAIHVRDHGPGIPASEQERVFERFYRREDPFTMRTGGAGLGLHIARELAVAMSGRLWVRTPADGTGAEFILELPRVTDDAPRLRDTVAAQAADPSDAHQHGSIGLPHERLVAP